MDWIPIVLLTFKFVVLGTGMFFAIKWHYDQSEKDQDKKKEMRTVLRGGAKAAVIFLLALAGLLLLTYDMAKRLGLDMTLP